LQILIFCSLLKQWMEPGHCGPHGQLVVQIVSITGGGHVITLNPLMEVATAMATTLTVTTVLEECVEVRGESL